ncbi:hypothetical protein vseg_006173 [Gypsophila vaccaria]
MSIQYSSSISPSLYSSPMGSKSRMQNGSMLHLHGDSAYVQCVGSIRAGISARTFHRNPYNFFRDCLVTKAVKTDDPEVSSFGEEEITYDLDWSDDDDEGSPWEGAIFTDETLQSYTWSTAQL